MVASMALHLFGLPANWVILGLAALWVFGAPQTTFGLGALACMGILALVGEVLEAVMLHVWGKKHGASGKGSFGGLVGAIIGAIVGAPFFFGIGAFFGALGGAFIGALAVELFQGKPNEKALRAAWGTMLGRFGGSVLKAALGGAMIVVAAPKIWAG